LFLNFVLDINPAHNN